MTNFEIIFCTAAVNSRLFFEYVHGVILKPRRVPNILNAVPRVGIMLNTILQVCIKYEIDET